jgi:hypothetical protein
MSAGTVRAVVLALCLSATAACRAARPSDLPVDSDWIVAVKSARMPDGEPAVTHFAHHSWIDLKRGDERSWRRIEVLGSGSGVRRRDIGPASARADVRWGDRDVRLLACIDGPDARRIAEAVEARAEELSRRYRDDYRAWPGPNSNTLLADIGREVPGFGFRMHHNAVGKDYPGWIEAGWTSSRTGVHVDTLPVGLALGLQEGIELHLLQLTFGVSLWPPRIQLPFLPEIPWSDDVEVARHEPPPARSFVLLLEDAYMSSGTEDIDPTVPGTWRIEAVDAEEWHWLEHTWLAPDAAHPGGAFAVRVRSRLDAEEREEQRIVPLVAGRAEIFRGALEGRTVSITLEALENGGFRANVEAP